MIHRPKEHPMTDLEAPLVLTRRRGIAMALAACAPTLPACAQPSAAPRNANNIKTLQATPAQTEGPYYPDEWPADSDADLLVVGNGAPYAMGQRTQLTGSVVDPDGTPVRGARVEIWQCDGRGRYHHPRDGNRADTAFQGRGRSAVDAQGRYAFRTLRPSPYVGRTPHIHVKVWLGERELLTTQLYVQGDPGNERDSLWRGLRGDAARSALTVPFISRADGWMSADFPIVVSA
jgi:protocatechuate 3,4-dioxygenase, beta subunit